MSKTRITNYENLQNFDKNSVAEFDKETTTVENINILELNRIQSEESLSFNEKKKRSSKQYVMPKIEHDIFNEMEFNQIRFMRSKNKRRMLMSEKNPFVQKYLL